MPWALDLLFRCSLREHVAPPPVLASRARGLRAPCGTAFPGRLRSFLAALRRESDAGPKSVRGGAVIIIAVPPKAA